ncbi:FMN-dependent NADH-azoreductase [Edaphosphingomonas haloaromaticamans]|uniref:FMN dependent NADH:quinone oxidoreductase n=1 Tax=Edaphosphingomonas haloaromaticamans TaxID=653954 RepID=A0A1S1HAX3_9SPHN|nr:NAD(P)H-dependent oxidoreductase [Sphingomonas haloaromaticamans]OHT18972.1 FMN-dependent NADH-azoreductase 1 [Sphingomonas haloaromaticamans]
MNLLHLDSSIQGERSASRALTAAIVDRLRAENPGLAVDYRDLAAAPPAHLALADLAEVAEGDDLKAFLNADIVVIGAGMYNFTIPSQLKAWIDRILVAGQTFRYGANGPEGLAGGKRVIVALSRGGLYGPGSPAAAAEHAETYLRSVFGFIGVTALEVIVAEGLAISEATRTAAMAAALDQAALIAA